MKSKKKNKAREKLNADPYLVMSLDLTLSPNRHYSRKQLQVIHFDYSDAEIRKAKKALSYDRAILTGFKAEGYRYAKHSSTMTAEETKAEIQEIVKMIAFYQSYISSMKMSMRPLIAHKKMLEKSLLEEVKQENVQQLNSWNEKIKDFQ